MSNVYLRYCANTWCEYATDNGYCKITDCINQTTTSDHSVVVATDVIKEFELFNESLQKQNGELFARAVKAEREVEILRDRIRVLEDDQTLMRLVSVLRTKNDRLEKELSTLKQFLQNWHEEG